MDRVEHDASAVLGIVLNWNGEHDTAACLDSLLAQQPVAPQILLVDNASADGSGERLRARFPSVHYLQTGENLGYAGGNNRGLAWGLERAFEWMLVINNDTVVDPRCLERMLDAVASHDRAAAVAPLIVRFDTPERVWFAGGSFSRARAAGRHENEGRLVTEIVPATDGPPRFRRCTFLTGCCLLLRSQALQQVGLFREDFFAYVEDLELGHRLMSVGWELGWAPAALLAHRVPPRAAPPSPWQITLRDRNRRRMVRDSYGWGWRIVFHARFWPTRLLSVAAHAATADWPRVNAIIRGMLDD